MKQIASAIGKNRFPLLVILENSIVDIRCTAHELAQSGQFKHTLQSVQDPVLVHFVICTSKKIDALASSEARFALVESSKLSGKHSIWSDTLYLK